MTRAAVLVLMVCVVGCTDARGKTAPHTVAAEPVRDPEPPTQAQPQTEPLAEVVAEPEPEPRTPVLDCTRVKEVGYRKGRRFPIVVVEIDGRPVEEQTASAYWAMREAAAADGLELPIYSGFRTAAEQKYFYRCYKTCSCNQCIRAAKPGYSNHQSGRALDLGQRPGVHDWLRENAGRFGFVDTVRSEPWHWEYRWHQRRSRRAKPRFARICAPDGPGPT